jgi:WD40 repeat protein
MDERTRRTWVGLTTTGVILAFACAAIGIWGVWWSAHRADPSSSLAPGPASNAASSGRIAYVGTDGNIYTVAPDGTRLVALTRNRPTGTDRYNALAWSPDGRLAFASSTGEGSTLYTAQPDGTERTRVFSGGPDAAPFYLYWSPNGQQLAFLTPSQSSQLALWIADGHAADSAQTIAQGSPSYFSWASNSQSLLMHMGRPQGGLNDTHMAIFDPSQSMLVELPDTPGGFQAPAWSPNSRQFLFARQGSQRTSELVLAEGDDRRVLASSRTGMAFAWSPAGDRIAYSSPDPVEALLYGSVVVTDLEGKERSVVAQGQIMAFFWSPDGKRLAVLNFDPGGQERQGRTIPVWAGAAPRLQSADVGLAWSVVNLADGTLMDYASFQPTESFLLLVPYFDQYAQSLSLWSPDGRYLVYADVNDRDQASIRVLDTLEPLQPARRLAEGTFAAWSWH